MTVRAYYNESAIAFLPEWGDRFKDTEHRPGPDPDLNGSTYPVIDLRKAGTEKLRDAVRLQFPVTIPAGPERPHFFLGSQGKPVVLWHWQAELDEAGRNSVVKEAAEGFERPIRAQADAAQDVTGKGVWKDGRWRVVMTRTLAPKPGERDVTFEVGRLIPFAVQAWDGANGEKGLMMSLSSWNYLTLEAAPPFTAYLYTLLAIGFAGALEWWVVRRVRGAPARASTAPGRAR